MKGIQGIKQHRKSWGHQALPVYDFWNEAMYCHYLTYCNATHNGC
jgi:hypothetical protein